MSEFIEECRREWRRLGVPDPVGNEMAADLADDFNEVEAEGGSAEDVLGDSAFDPRRFAAAWASARGVTGRPIADRPSFRRTAVAMVLAALVGALTVGSGLVLLVGSRSGTFSMASRRIIEGPGPMQLFPPSGGRIGFPGPVGPPFLGVHIGVQESGAGFHVVAGMLIIVGGIGLGLFGLLALLYWSPWARSYRFRRGG